MNYFGVFTNPDLQTAMSHAVKGSYMPHKYEFIHNLKQVNKNFRNSLALNDLQKMELYLQNSKRPTFSSLIKQFNQFNFNEAMWKKHEYATWATYLIYQHYLNKKSHDQFGLTMWEQPGPNRPSNQLLMKYIKMMSKPNLTTTYIYNFCYNNFTVSQLSDTYY